ncbi:hypothetical protein BASA81_010026 [Batrachochytrium salamandrivorans]|nr:hypothetical protein BASA81_010026 [Batrachochytrium salamandrivorans]
MEKDLGDKYELRSKIMVERWAGVKQPARQPVLSDGGKPIQPQFVNRRISTLGHHLGHYAEPSKSIPVFAECEVLVVGGGPAGLAAAVSAARAGAQVMLLERFGCFGGVITTVGMETLAWYRYPGTTDVTGIGIEMERLAQQMSGGQGTKFPFNDSACLDADVFKLVADHLVRENAIRPLLHAMVVDVIMESRSTIAGVVVECKSGRLAIRAQRVVDCTGDADVAFLAGATCKKYAKSDMMGVTSVFSVAGVDKSKFLSYVEAHPATYKDWSRTWKQTTDGGKEDHLLSPYLDEEFERAQELGVISNLPDEVSIGGSWSSLTNAGEATNLNLVHQRNIDGTNVEDLTKAEMEGRRQVLQAIAGLQSQVPGFKAAKLRNFSMTLGVRDTRKIVGRYELTDHDCRSQARFADSIGIFPEFIDGYNILILPTTGRYFQVPLGICQSNEVENLLVAGRCTSGDRTAHAAMRNMMACCVTGAGAGVAAAVSVQTGTPTSQVDVAKVQRELVRQGTRIA